MKLPYSKKLTSPNKAKTNKIHKKPNRPKFLKYKPKKGEESKQWQIERIVDQRLVLKSQNNNNMQKAESQNNLFIVMPSQMEKQYLIAWKQSSQKGLWPDTWQPQENIPDYTRLDYLLEKKNQIKSRNQTRIQDGYAKNKQNLQKHKKLVNNKTIVNKKSLSKRKIRESTKKIIENNQKPKSPERELKNQNYKSWAISYNSRPQQFKKIIYRFIKGQANNSLQDKDCERKQRQIQRIEKNRNQSLQQQDMAGEQKRRPLSSDLSEKFVEYLCYHQNVNQIDYFQVVAFDGSLRYITEEDLIKHFPFAYQKFLRKKIGQSIQQIQNTLSQIDIHTSDIFNQKSLENLGQQIGIQSIELYFDSPNCIFDSISNTSQFGELSFIFGNRQIHHNFSQPQRYLQKQSNSLKLAFSSTKDQDEMMPLNKVYTYFQYIEQCAEQPEIIQFESSQKNQQLAQKPKQNYLKNFADCKELFKRNQKKKSKNNQNQQHQIKLQNSKKDSLEKKQARKLKVEDMQKVKDKFRQQVEREKKHEKQVKQQKKRQVTEIAADQSKQKNLSRLKSKIQIQENQIFQILQTFEKNTKNPDNYYDSDDEA